MSRKSSHHESAMTKDELVFTDHLRHAWAARVNQDLLLAIDRLSQLMLDLGIPQGRFNDSYPKERLVRLLASSSDTNRRLILETLVLWASILRAQRLVTSSEDVLAYVANVIQSEASGTRANLVAKLSQERGLNAYIADNFTSSLEFFLTQYRYSDNSEDRFRASVNALLSAESLGLPLDVLYARAKSALQELRRAKADLSPHFDATLRAYEYGVAFQEGRTDALLGSNAGVKKTPYLNYLCGWIQLLPWHIFYNPASSVDLGTMYLGEYRTRTLQGRSLPDDIRVMPTTDIITRAYVWLWRWLLNPKTTDVERVYQTIAASKLQTDFIPPTQIHMLRLTLEWLSLFDGEHRLKMERWADQLAGQSPISCPVFTRELYLVQYVKALKSGDRLTAGDIKQTLKNRQTSEGPVLFENIMLAIYDENAALTLRDRAPWTADFVATLREEVGVHSGQPPTSGSAQNTKKTRRAEVNSSRRHRVRIDLSAASVELLLEDASDEMNSDPQKKSWSKPLVTAVALLKANQNVSRSDFIAEIWGIQSYDPLIHDGKIMNLLARMRSVIGGSVRFGVKDKTVFAVGDWSHVEFIGSFAHTRMISSQAGASLGHRMGASKNHRDTKHAVVIAKINAFAATKNVRILTRREIEQVLEMPRSSCNRLIDKFILSGTLVPKGKGPRRVYELQESWRISK